MLALGGSALLLLRSVQVYFQSQLRFACYGATDVLHTLTRVSLVLVALRATLATPTALLGCYALAPLLIVAAFSRVLWLRADYHASPAKSRRHLLRFAGTAFVTIALSAVIGRLDLFMTQVAGNSVEAGLFGAAMVIALIPEMIGSYLTPVFSPRIIRWRQQGTLYSFYRSFQILLWIACAVGLAAALLFSGKIIPLVFPARFAGSSQIVQVLLPGAFAGLVTFPLTLSLLTFFAPRTFIVFDSISLPFLAGGYYLLAQSHGALGVAFLSSISRVVKMLYLQVVAIRVARRIGRQSIPASMSPALCPVPAGD
jgi:O-antigen/teichoic acid export membrane protein